tara:strand:- start:126 stop:518 length:393 start_codon:yes stop_codon:yes gene_type:complete
MRTPIVKRFFGYTFIGVCTFIFDLLLVYLGTQIGLTEYFSVVFGFLIAVSLNFYLSYRFVFRGTEQTVTAGYLFFMGIAVLGFLIIGPATVFLKEAFSLNLYFARTIVGGIVGTGNFVLNNFLNFKMGTR